MQQIYDLFEQLLGVVTAFGEEGVRKHAFGHGHTREFS